MRARTSTSHPLLDAAARTGWPVRLATTSWVRESRAHPRPRTNGRRRQRARRVAEAACGVQGGQEAPRPRGGRAGELHLARGSAPRAFSPWMRLPPAPRARVRRAGHPGRGRGGCGALGAGRAARCCWTTRSRPARSGTCCPPARSPLVITRGAGDLDGRCTWPGGAGGAPARRSGSPPSQAASDLARQCDYLPLALCRPRLATRPSWPVHALADASATSGLTRAEVGRPVRSCFQVATRIRTNWPEMESINQLALCAAGGTAIAAVKPSRSTISARPTWAPGAWITPSPSGAQQGPLRRAGGPALGRASPLSTRPSSTASRVSSNGRSTA